MRIWSYPGIYPFPEKNDLTTGIFIHKQNLALKSLGVDIQVVQYQDWAPVKPLDQIFGDWKTANAKKRPVYKVLDGIPVHHPVVFKPKPSRLFKKPHSFYLINRLVTFFKEKGVQKGKDIIHAQWLIPDGHIALQVAKRLGIACSVEMQGDDIVVWPHKSTIHKNNALWTLENADLVLGCSDFLCNEALKLYNKPLNTHTIYTGIDYTKFSPAENVEARQKLRAKYNIENHEIVILNVGSAIQRKGWLELFQSVLSLRRRYPNIKILAASGGIQDFKLSEKAEEYGVADCLIDLGQVHNDKLLELYRLCDIFALPSYWEGLANVLCEAMASGCAVVTSNVAGHPEVVKHGINGFLIDAQNVESLTEALERLISSDQLRSEFGKNARATAIQKIRSHEDNAAMLIQLFEKVI